MELKLKKEYGKLDDYVYGKIDGDYRNVMRVPIVDCGDSTFDVDELPSPTSDKIFKRMFAQESTKEYACLLLSCILEVDLDYLISNMKLYTKEFTSKQIDGKCASMDFVGVCDGIYFSIEMNNTNTLERNADYAHRLYATEVKEGSKKDAKYVSVFQMNINNFTVRNVTEPVNISVTTNGKDRRTKIVYADVYLPLIDERFNEGGIGNLKDGERKILAMFASYISKAEKLGRGDERTMKFIKKLKQLRNNKKVLREYRNFSRDKEDGIIIGESRGREEGIIIGESRGREEGIAIGESRGREEGIAIGESRGREEGIAIGESRGREEGIAIGESYGREEARIETAKVMLADGIDSKTISKYTTLSLEQVEELT